MPSIEIRGVQGQIPLESSPPFWNTNLTSELRLHRSAVNPSFYSLASYVPSHERFDIDDRASIEGIKPNHSDNVRSHAKEFHDAQFEPVRPMGRVPGCEDTDQREIGSVSRFGEKFCRIFGSFVKPVEDYQMRVPRSPFNAVEYPSLIMIRDSVVKPAVLLWLVMVFLTVPIG